MALRKNGDTWQALLDRARQRIERTEILDLLIEQLNPNGQLTRFGRKNIDHVASDAIGPSFEIDVIACVLEFSELPQHTALIDNLAS